MKFNIYTIFDAKAQAYLRPEYRRSDEEMFAAIYETAKDQNSGFYKHPDDYTVYKLGTFDESNAEIEYHGPHSIGTVLDIRIFMQKKHVAAMRRLKLETVDDLMSKEEEN